MIPESQLAHWEQLCREANDGPWVAGSPDGPAQWMIHDRDWCIAEATAYTHDRAYGAKRGPGYVKPDANAAFIAEARTALPVLLAEVRRLTTESHAREVTAYERFCKWADGVWTPDQEGNCRLVAGDAVVKYLAFWRAK